jgi:hypothetical protein
MLFVALLGHLIGRRHVSIEEIKNLDDRLCTHLIAAERNAHDFVNRPELAPEN